jgi:hypothetical protein
VEDPKFGTFEVRAGGREKLMGGFSEKGGSPGQARGGDIGRGNLCQKNRVKEAAGIVCLTHQHRKPAHVWITLYLPDLRFGQYRALSQSAAKSCFGPHMRDRDQ